MDSGGAGVYELSLGCDGRGSVFSVPCTKVAGCLRRASGATHVVWAGGGHASTPTP